MNSRSVPFDTKSEVCQFKFKVMFSFWVFNFLLLGVLGGQPVEYPYSEVSVVVSFFYFFFFLLLL